MQTWTWAHQVHLKIAARDEKSKEVKHRSKVYVSLIDVIFGIVIALSFGSIPPVLQTAVQAPFSFSVWSLAVAYGMVATSWVSYHASVRKQPHKTWFRFVLDLLLVFDYFVIVNYSSIPRVVFPAYVAMFLLYVFWDALKWVEYPDVEVPKKAALRVAYPIASVGLLLLVWGTGNWNAPGSTAISVAWLLVALVGTVVLRGFFRGQPLINYLSKSPKWKPQPASEELKAMRKETAEGHVPESKWY
jgi:hypothetical protein